MLVARGYMRARYPLLMALTWNEETWPPQPLPPRRFKSENHGPGQQHWGGGDFWPHNGALYVRKLYVAQHKWIYDVEINRS